MPNQDQPELPFESRSRDLAGKVDPVVELPDGSFKRLSEVTDAEAREGYGVRLDLNEPEDFDEDLDEDVDEDGPTR
jgi:hypothetical protein